MLIDAATRLAGGFLRRGSNIQNPAIPLTASNIESYLVQQGESAGMRVSKDTCLANPALFNGIRLLSESVAKLPLVVYRRLPEGGKERDTNHPAFPLLWKRPNDSATAFDFIRTLTANAILHGNGYAYILRDGAGRPRRLLWLDPEYTYPCRVREFLNARFWEERIEYMTHVEGHDLRLPSQNVLHIKSFGHDDMVGHSILKVLAEPLGLSLAHQRYSAKFFENDGTPRLIVTLPFNLKSEQDVERFRKSWGDIHKGVNNSHKIGILEGGGDVKPLSVNPEDAQLNEPMEMDVKSIANILGIPASLLNADISTSYNSLEQQNRNFLSYSLGGLLCNWKHECEAKLLAEEEQRNDTHVIEQERGELERADRATEAAADVQELNNGIVTLDEIRARRNRAPLPDGLGSTHRIPVNIGVMGETMPQDTPADPEPDADPMDDGADQDRSEPQDERLKRQLLQAASECVTRLKLQAKRASGNPDRFFAWLDKVTDERATFVSKLPACERAGTVAEVYLEHLHEELLEASGRVTHSQLSDCVSQIMVIHEKEQPAKLVEQLLQEN